jgi:hypothetical protein
MRPRAIPGACSLFVLLLCMSANAAEMSDCLKLAVAPDGAASLTNVCSDHLNVTYCVDNPNSAKTCSQTPLGVTPLAPEAVELIPAYTAEGAGNVYWAACATPLTPINWKPGPQSTFICRKMCTMC